MSGDLFASVEAPRIFAIFNSNGFRWGKETYASEADARRELKQFFKGVSGVKFDRFYVEELEPSEKDAKVLPRLSQSTRKPESGEG